MFRRQVNARSGQNIRSNVIASATGYVDDTAERNDVFYNANPKVKVMYPKKLVYPPEGGEYSLEELRALQYPFNDDDDDNGMEMTEVIHKDITTNIPVIQVGGKAQLQPNNIGGVKRAVGVGRKPLSQLQPVDEELEELEQMLDNKAPVVLKTENSFGVSNISYKSDRGDSLSCDVRNRRCSRCAIKLIDFGRSIDMRAFDSSTQFTGSCNTSGFVCTEMKTGKPWNWQVGYEGVVNDHMMLVATPTHVDFYAVAATVYCLIHGNYMEVIRMPGAGYKPRRNPPKYYNAMMIWNKMFTQLLNTDHVQPPAAPLDQLANQLSRLVTTNVTSSINSLLDRMMLH